MRLEGDREEPQGILAAETLETDASEENVPEQAERRKARTGLWQRARRSAAFQIAFFVLVTVLEFVILELFFRTSVLDYSAEIILKNVLIIGFINLFLVGIFHSAKLPLMLSVAFFTIVGAANYFVIAFRGYGIVFMDLYAVKTAAGVAGEYRYQVEWHFLLALALAAGLFGSCFLLPKRRHAYRHIKYTFLSLSGMAVSTLFFFWLSADTFFFQDVSHLTWDHNIGMKNYGYVLYFASNAGKVTVTEPEGYSVQRAEKILSRYDERKASREAGQQKKGSTAGKNPNLIMIMNESFADLSVLGNVSTNAEVLSFYNSLTENTIKGFAESSVYGGYTSNSEFEFLTGCSKAFLPGNPYLQYLDAYVPSLITRLKEQEGYDRAIAVHPYYPSGYNRNRVYPLLGFDEFLSLEDFSGDGLVRDYVGDLADYQKLEELYEQKEEGTSLCVFNVTMQNHGSYSDTAYSFENPVRVTNFSAASSVNQYLSLIKMSDNALRQLITYFQGVEEPTLIVLFGDHQPHLPDSFYQEVMGLAPDFFTREQNMKKYLVPFMIWANYDIPEQEIDKISLNYLSGLVLQTAGLKMSNYDYYLMDLYQKLPSISANGYYDADGALHDFQDKEEEYQTLIDEYEMVQYYYLFDKKNRSEKYFTVK